MGRLNTRKLQTFGWQPDPKKRKKDKPDRVFELQLKPRLSVPQAGYIDLSPFTTETDQLNASSCVGNASGDSVEVLNTIEGRPQVQVSRLYIYNMARSLMDVDQDGRGDINHDDGTYIRLAFEVLSKFGVCPEDLWPYDLKKNLYRMPSMKAMRAATGNRIHSYYRIVSQKSGRCDAVIEALRAKHPVVFGTTVNESFMKLREHSSSNPVLPMTKDAVGGHAMLIVGFVSPGVFLVKNSWSKRWGNGGFCFMSPETIAHSSSRDFWVPTLGTTFR